MRRVCAAICWAFGEVHGSRAMSPLYTCSWNLGLPWASICSKWRAHSCVCSDWDLARHSAMARIPGIISSTIGYNTLKLHSPLKASNLSKNQNNQRSSMCSSLHNFASFVVWPPIQVKRMHDGIHTRTYLILGKYFNCRSFVAMYFYISMNFNLMQYCHWLLG